MRSFKSFNESYDTKQVVDKIMGMAETMSFITTDMWGDPHIIRITGYLDAGRYKDAENDVDIHTLNDKYINYLYLAGVFFMDEGDDDHYFGNGNELVSKQIVAMFKPDIQKAAKKKLVEMLQDEPHIYTKNKEFFDNILDIPNWLSRGSNAGLMDINKR